MYPAYNPVGAKISTDVDGLGAERGFIVRFRVADDDAVAASDDAVLEATELDEEDELVVTKDIENPAVPRALRVKGSAVGMEGDVVIGTNYNGDAITETFELNGNNAVEGSKAFASITSITLPERTAEGNAVSVGWNDKLGLPFKLPHNTVLAAYLDNTKEANAPTVATSATLLENNTIDLHSALAGKAVDVYLIV